MADLTEPMSDQNSLDEIDKLVSSLTDGAVTRLKKKWQFNHSGRQALEMMADDIKLRAKAAINKTIMEDFLAIIGEDNKEGDEVEDSIIPMQFTEVICRNAFKAELRQAIIKKYGAKP